MHTEAWLSQIHERLLAGDPTASAELMESMLEPLTRSLGKKYPALRESESLVDAVVDALVDYVKRPSQFDPTKRGLIGYLGMAAEGDLRNSLAKKKRKREISLEDVEVELLRGNQEPGRYDADLVSEEVRQEIEKLFDERLDKKLLDLILEGERS